MKSELTPKTIESFVIFYFFLIEDIYVYINILNYLTTA